MNLKLKIGDRFVLKSDLEGHASGSTVTIRKVGDSDMPFEECAALKKTDCRHHRHGTHAFIEMTGAMPDINPEVLKGLRQVVDPNDPALAPGVRATLAPCLRCLRVEEVTLYERLDEAYWRIRGSMDGGTGRLRIADGRLYLSGSAPGGRQQVSHDGRSWVDYETIGDPDAFETYKRRRVLRGGQVVEEHGKEEGPVRLTAVGKYGTYGQCQVLAVAQLGSKQCTEGASIGQKLCEKHIAIRMKRADEKRSPMQERVEAPSPFANRRFLDGAERPWDLP